MNKWILGTALIAIGLVLIGVGLAGRGESRAAPVDATPTSEVPSAPVTQPPSTTTTLPAPTATTGPAPTTTAAVPTTTTVPPPSVEEFILAYAAATTNGDGVFLFDRLLPQLVDVFGADICRAFIENEIVALSEYTLIGDVSGPFARSLNVGDQQIDVDRYYEAPVQFTFQGQSFETTATFVAQDGLVYWIGDCR